MKYLLMYNPVSGRSKFKKKIPFIKAYFEKRHLDLDIYESKKANDLERYVEIIASDYDVIFVAGGDGTVNEVVNGLMKTNHQPVIAILPSGTANDIAAILGVPKTLKRALNMYLKVDPVMIDVNQMNDRYFVYTASSGILSKVSYDVSRRRLKKYGYLAYVFAGMKDLRQDYNYPVIIEYNGQTLETNCMMILGLSSNRVGGMKLINFSHSRINDGLFDLRIFTGRRKFRRFRLLSSFIRGGKKLREDYHLKSNHYKITATKDVIWNADGEKATEGSIEIKTHKQTLKVYCDPKRRKKQCE